ncbi:TIGR02206 family membrane protein [Kamptonema cortianum]|nr:TIGR02206 family membrane protein [Kamptonema cortianum]
MPEFRLFSLEHFVALLVIGAICAGCLRLRHARLSESHIRTGAWAITLMLLGYAVVSYARIIGQGSFTWQTGLPLHLCDVLVIVCALALLTRKYLLFETAYFFGLAGTLQTLITPNLDVGFPTLRCLIFFLDARGHLVAVCFMIGAFRLRPRPGCVMRMFVAINLYVAVALAVNWALDANYGFLCHPPMNQENLILAISRWAPWPWYILVLEAIAVASFLIYYAPWFIKDRWTRKT